MIFKKFWTLQESREASSTVTRLCSWGNTLNVRLNLSSAKKISPTNVRPAGAESRSHSSFALSVAGYFTPTIFPNFFFFCFPIIIIFFANALSLLIIDGGDPRISKRRRGTQLQWCQTRRTYTVVAAMDERRARFKEQNEERESPIVPQWDDPIGEAWGVVGGGA